MKLKPIGQQVVVIVGASSGIGRETAQQFARIGAKVVVAAACGFAAVLGGLS
jgi:NAD(P)-dependent dehydrogenase (short-subunit alcohol dehydrogenase family)